MHGITHTRIDDEAQSPVLFQHEERPHAAADLASPGQQTRAAENLEKLDHVASRVLEHGIPIWMYVASSIGISDLLSLRLDDPTKRV